MKNKTKMIISIIDEFTGISSLFKLIIALPFPQREKDVLKAMFKTRALPFLKVFFLGTFFLFLQAKSDPFIPNLSLRHSVDSLFGLSDPINFTTIIHHNNSKIYVGTSCRTMNIPFADIEVAFRDYKWVTGHISAISRFKKISQGTNLSAAGTFDFEAKIGIAKGWAILNIDSIQIDTSGYFRMVFVGNDDAKMDSIFRPFHKGFFIAKGNNFYIEWRIVKLNASQSRIGFITWLSPQMYVPEWLFKFASKIALPGILKDLEKALKKKNSEKTGTVSS
jgi:hypothetical protein